MPADITLAFGTYLDLVSTADLLQRLQPEVRTTATDVGAGQHVIDAHVEIGGRLLPSSIRLFDEGGWTSVAIDVPTPDFEHAEADVGRRRAVWALVRLAARIIGDLGAPYVYVDEEIEADLAPDQFDPLGPLPGITVVRPDFGHAAGVRRDLLRVDTLPLALVLWRRPHPLPHVEPGGRPPLPL